MDIIEIVEKRIKESETRLLNYSGLFMILCHHRYQVNYIPDGDSYITVWDFEFNKL